MRNRTIPAAIATLIHAATGCIHMRPASSPNAMRVAIPSARCQTLSARVLGLNLAGIVAGGLAGGATTAAALVPAGAPRWGVSGTASGLALSGALVGYLATYEAAAFTRECP